MAAAALRSPPPPPRRIAVIGGGASGIFASIQAAEQLRASPHSQSTSTPSVVVLEATSKTLHKVKISGGGRCNVLHDTSKPISTLLAGYPRGEKELRGLFHKHFPPAMARDWFESRGVELKVESDGRVFPVTDSSETILQTLTGAAEQAGVNIRLQQKVTGVDVADISTQGIEGKFTIHFKDETTECFDAVIMATGSSPIGYQLVENLGHKLVKPVPSLFTLNCKPAVSDGGLLHGLAGVSVPSSRVSLTKKLSQEGPLLITHHGISGPAALRLSAFAAREFHEHRYRDTHVTVHWDTVVFGNQPEKVLEDQLWPVTTSNPKRSVASVCPVPGNSIPRRLWSALVKESGITEDTVWGAVSKKLARKLATNIVACPLEITGKGTFKEEFVTAGGVSLKEVDMKTMESKCVPGLYFCGELINVDGITGGFNFMNCWSTGFMAGNGAAKQIILSSDGKSLVK